MLTLPWRNKIFCVVDRCESEASHIIIPWEDRAREYSSGYSLDSSISHNRSKEARPSQVRDTCRQTSSVGKVRRERIPTASSRGSASKKSIDGLSASWCLVVEGAIPSTFCFVLGVLWRFSSEAKSWRKSLGFLGVEGVGEGSWGGSFLSASGVLRLVLEEEAVNKLSSSSSHPSSSSTSYSILSW